VWDDVLGVYYAKARFYEPGISRFLSPDPYWHPGNMIYGDNPQDPLGLGCYVPNIYAIQQSSNLYVYCINNPVLFSDPSGEFVITTTALLIIGGAALFGTAGGFVGNHYANQAGATGWNRVGYIAGGATIGAAGGAALGWMAAPAVIGATGVGAISVTSAGISTIAATGTSFSTMGTLIAQNPNITINWSAYAKHGLERMAERGITQQMVNTWVSTGKVLQQSADKFAFVTREGVAVVDRAGKLITTWSSSQFDPAMQEIVKKLFGG
jgi:RHS repeat-associated protein